MTLADGFFQPCWIRVFEETLAARSASLTASRVYERNAVLAYLGQHKVEYTIVNGEGLPAFLSEEEQSLLLQFFILQQSTDGESYMQMVHPNCRKSQHEWLFLRVPFYSDASVIERTMEGIHFTELAIDAMRVGKRLPAIPAKRKHLYFNDDVFTEEAGPDGMTMLLSNPLKCGHLIDRATSLLSSAIGKMSQGRQNTVSEETIRLVAYNTYVNGYFLTHLLFGYHGQFTTLDELAWIAGHTLGAGVRVGSGSTAPHRQMHLVVMKNSRWLNGNNAIINDNFAQYIRRDVGSEIWTKDTHYRAQFQHVDDSGQAFFLAARLALLSEATDATCRISKPIRMLMQRVEEQAKHQGDSAPLVLFAFEDSIRSEKVFESLCIDEMDGQFTGRLPVTKVPLINLMV